MRKKKRTYSRKIKQPGVVGSAGERSHPAVADPQTDWLAVIDRVREERTQAALGLSDADDLG